MGGFWTPGTFWMELQGPLSGLGTGEEGGVKFMLLFFLNP